MLKHIENGECRNGWTIQHLNKLAEECNACAYFLIRERRWWFRAGAPPLKPKPTDYRPHDGFFVCSICDEMFEREFQLREHLREQVCSRDYPSVLQCPRCPNTGFQRLSELFKHFERPECQCDRRLVESLAHSLKRKLEDIGVQERLDRDPVRLRADRRRPGRLRLIRSYEDFEDGELDLYQGRQGR